MQRKPHQSKYIRYLDQHDIQVSNLRLQLENEDDQQAAGQADNGG